MKRILVIGNLVLDIVNQVDTYPAENSEVRAQRHWTDLGGNGGNLARVLAQGRCQVELLAKTANDDNGHRLKTLAAENSIQLHTIAVEKAHTPCSYIALSAKNGSRSIVHYRELEELNWQDCENLDFSAYDWIHLEARNCEFQQELLQNLQAFNSILSLEVEKNRDGVHKLFPLVDYIILSSDFVCKGAKDHQSFLNKYDWQERNKAILACAGEQGAFFRGVDKSIVQAKANPIVAVDTIGAGDTFNAGFIYAMLNNKALAEAVAYANALAAKRIQQKGFNNLISD